MLNREQWRALEPLLDHALSLSDEARDTWLVQLKEKAPELGAQLGSLLAGEAVADRREFLAAPLSLTTNEVLVGDYRLEKQIAEGGSGSVWVARRTGGDRGYVALKLLHFSLRGSVSEQRFRREGELLAQLAHPGIAQILAAGVSDDGLPYLVLELVDGKPIDAFASERPLSVIDRVELLRRVLAPVAYAHAKGIVHRDLKPSNILVLSDGSVKLLDFGIAKLVGQTRDPLRSLTARGGRALTPDFAAPEQVVGDAITAATDVYALGVLLYLLISGRHPTADRAHSLGDALTSLLKVEPEPLGLGDLDSVIGRMLRKSAAARYQDVTTLDNDLGRWTSKTQPYNR